MASQTHLRLFTPAPEDGQIHCNWITLQDNRVASEFHQGDLASAAGSIDTDQVVVYVPAMEVLLTRVKLPGGRRSQLQHALPYALEENLTEEVDTLHCSLGARNTDGRYAAAVVRREAMEYWLERLAEVGIAPRALYSEIMLLPWFENDWSITCLENRIQIRTGSDEGFVCQAGMVPRLLNKALEQKTAPGQVHVYGCEISEQEVFQSLIPESCKIVTHDIPASRPLISLLHESPHGPDSSLNLLQNEYAPRSRIRQQLRPWYTTAALVAALILVGLLGNILEYISLSGQSEQLDQQIRQTFSRTFPEVKRIVNPTAQMKHQLAQLRGKGQSGPAFSEILSSIAPQVAKTPNITVRYVRYQNGQMELLLDLPDLQTLEKLKNRLNEATAWQTEIKSANSSDNKVQGQLLIHEKS
jgi:general secretion pathway protein L